jgi:hypothetical protein
VIECNHMGESVSESVSCWCQSQARIRHQMSSILGVDAAYFCVMNDGYDLKE